MLYVLWPTDTLENILVGSEYALAILDIILTTTSIVLLCMIWYQCYCTLPCMYHTMYFGADSCYIMLLM